MKLIDKKTFYTSTKIPNFFMRRLNIFLEFYDKTFMNFKNLLSELLLIKIQSQIFVHFHNSLQKSQKNHEFFLKDIQCL